MYWDGVYINAINQLVTRELTGTRRSKTPIHQVARRIRDRIARRAWNAACEWQVDWGDPHNPGKVHPDLTMVEEEDAP